jgi:flavin-dependent dehydrogenase
MRARVVIAADGRHSRVARGLGLSRFAPAPRRWAVGGYFDNVADLTTCGEMHIRGDRYLGVAPLPGGIANACVVATDREALRDPERLLLDSLSRDRSLAGRFARSRLIAPVVCLGPLAVECGTPGMEGLLLAGDAAGFIDPMTGDGLRFALRGAELTADLALDALAHGWRGAHGRLAAARRRAFRRKWRFNRTLRALVGSPASVRLADRGASIAPAAVRALIRYAADRRVA